MKKNITIVFCMALFSLLLNKSYAQYSQGTFGYDFDFLHQYQAPSLVVLKDKTGERQIVIVGDYQAKVMTSTAEGLNGSSIGWINYKLIASGVKQEHINAWGGEDRLWMGPEGGQYSIFFKPNMPFIFENWFTPASIDTDSYTLDSKSSNSASYSKHVELTNYQNFHFNIELHRTISLLNNEQMSHDLGMNIPSGIHCVAYKTDNRLTNVGKENWNKKTGVLSIWISGMYKPSDSGIIIIPYKSNLELNDRYFGKVSNARLKVLPQAVLYNADGKSRGKIGIHPKNALPYYGSYDPSRHLLTVIITTISPNEDYVNSIWEKQQYPYKGDAVNAYNDGPLESGGQIGPFYELESSSPGKALKIGQSISHEVTTFHFTGSEELLSPIAKKFLHVDLATVIKVFH